MLIKNPAWSSYTTSLKLIMVHFPYTEIVYDIVEPTEPYILKKGYFWVPKIVSDPTRTCVEKNMRKYFDDTLHPTPDEVFDVLLCFRFVPI